MVLSVVALSTEKIHGRADRGRFENQPLNKTGWLQALDELGREYVKFQTSANSNSTEHGRTNASKEHERSQKEDVKCLHSLYLALLCRS